MIRSFSAPVTPSGTGSDSEGRAFELAEVDGASLFVVVAVMDGITPERMDSIFEERDATTAEVGYTLSPSLFDAWLDAGRLDVTTDDLVAEPKDLSSSSGLDITFYTRHDLLCVFDKLGVGDPMVDVDVELGTVLDVVTTETDGRVTVA
ncbi:MAG: hypothetical protein M1816_000702 [Peltula sp. TS41687]|nr:MAG: hypothetical protein M1816_000702 [Peltula sp. TS41687]